MMRKTLLLILLTMLALVVASCNLSGVETPAAEQPTPVGEEIVPGAPVAVPSQPGALPMEYVGVYAAQLPATDTPGRNVTVVFAEDGAVTVTSDYLNGEPPIVETGTWQAAADGAVTAVITAQGDKAYFDPVAFILQLNGDELVATRQGQTEGVTLMRSTGEQAEPVAAEAPAPAESAPVTATVPVTTTTVVTATAPVTTTAALTITAPVTITAVVSPTTPMTATAPAEVVIENAYLGIRRTASGGGSALFALSLNEDGTVQYGTEFHNDQPALIDLGTWQDNGDGTLTVTLTGRADREFAEPIVITFARDGDLLRAVEYDPALFGSEGITLRLAADVVNDIEQALVTLDLGAGFPLDPTFVSVNGGGEVDASLLGAGCSGFINDKPVVTVHWTGDADFVEAFFVSDHDPTLVILTPDGRFLCNDDANEQLLDPVVEMQDPVEGTYRIWVGSYAKGQLIPGILVLTTKPDMNIGTFNLSSLIRRPAVAEALPEPTPSFVTSVITQTLAKVPADALVLTAGAAPLSAELTAAGSLPAFELPVVGARCSGFISDAADFIFGWDGAEQPLRIFFEGSQDATLLVVTPTGRVLCNDDAEAEVNVNPLIDIADAAPGAYRVFIGRLDPTAPVSGKLTVTEAMDAAPAVLAPTTR